MLKQLVLVQSTNEVVEYGICLFGFGRDTGEITEIVDNYVGNLDVRGKELERSRIEAMIHMGEFLIAHNASFDQSFIGVLFPNCNNKTWLWLMNGIN